MGTEIESTGAVGKPGLLVALEPTAGLCPIAPSSQWSGARAPALVRHGFGGSPQVGRMIPVRPIARRLRYAPEDEFLRPLRDALPAVDPRLDRPVGELRVENALRKVVGRVFEHRVPPVPLRQPERSRRGAVGLGDVEEGVAPGLDPQELELDGAVAAQGAADAEDRVLR